MSDQSTDFNKAGIFKRVFAFLYDTLLLIAMYFVIGGIAVAVNGGEKIPTEWSLLISAVIFPTCAFFFYYWFWKRCGQTLGMQAWRLKLIGNDPPITMKLSLIRFATSIIGLICGGIGFFWMLFDRQNRTWQDIASKSHVYEMPKK